MPFTTSCDCLSLPHTVVEHHPSGRATEHLSRSHPGNYTILAITRIARFFWKEKNDYKKYDHNYVQDYKTFTFSARNFKKTRPEQGFCACTVQSFDGIALVDQTYNLCSVYTLEDTFTPLLLVHSTERTDHHTTQYP